MSPSWEVNISSASQETLCNLCNQTFQFRVQNSHPTLPILHRSVQSTPSNNISLTLIFTLFPHLRLVPYIPDAPFITNHEPFQPSVTSSLLGRHIFLRTLFSETLNLYYFLNVGSQFRVRNICSSVLYCQIAKGGKKFCSLCVSRNSYDTASVVTFRKIKDKFLDSCKISFLQWHVLQN
jgi:hypothetical protein